MFQLIGLGIIPLFLLAITTIVLGLFQHPYIWVLWVIVFIDLLFGIYLLRYLHKSVVVPKKVVTIGSLKVNTTDPYQDTYSIEFYDRLELLELRDLAILRVVKTGSSIKHGL